ncbi:hypothetical protein [Paraburkholderia sp. GAS32]|uniref:hypothetical protein n=1 Tax=Paraburkholderia sp. GAS32 TaxID=3035129 RepID=UPI003D1D6077
MNTTTNAIAVPQTHNPTMKVIGFESVAVAKAYKEQHGGWVFETSVTLPDHLVWWFDMCHTPTRVMTHPCVRGMSGKLI